MLFTRACKELSIPQQIVLPQPREEFLNAIGSKGTPDFSEEERTEARRLLESPHVIHEQVVSNPPGCSPVSTSGCRFARAV